MGGVGEGVAVEVEVEVKVEVEFLEVDGFSLSLSFSLYPSLPSPTLPPSLCLPHLSQLFFSPSPALIPPLPPIPPPISRLQLAVKELQKLGSVKAPRDKLVCVLNCCRVINNLLLNSAIHAASLADGPHAELQSKAKPPGADDFLPVLIYVVLQVTEPCVLTCTVLLAVSCTRNF